MSDTTSGSGEATEKADGLGTEGTIPGGSGGVGVGASEGEGTTFEPEEDEEGAANLQGGSDGGDALGAAGHA